MLPALQPQRPKPPQQSSRPTYTHQQSRAVHDTPHPQSIPLSPSPVSSQPLNNYHPIRPRSQVEAMPPFGPGAPMLPPRGLYDPAMRHPVFFTEQLRKPPFPIPAMASQGWNPVASGYIFEQRKAETNGTPKTKL